MCTMAFNQHEIDRAERRPSNTVTSFMLMQVAMIAILLYQRAHNVLDPHHCRNVLEHGQWSHNPQIISNDLNWSPNGCSKQQYSTEMVRECLTYQDVQFRGDSTARELFWAIARKSDEEAALKKQSLAEKHSDIRFEAAQYAIQFIWDPFLNQSAGLDDVSDPDRERVTVAGAGLWHALYLERSADVLMEGLLRLSVQLGNDSYTRYPLPHLVVIPVVTPVHERLSEAKAAKMLDTTVTDLNQVLQSFDQQPDVDVAWAFSKMTHGYSSSLQGDGLHIMPEIASVQADLLLNRICSPLYRQGGLHKRPSCCTRPHYEPSQMVAIWLLSGVCLASSACLVVSECAVATHPFSFTRLRRITHTYLTNMATICAATLYCYLADRTDLFRTSDKVVDIKLFVGLSIVTMLCSFCALTRSPGSRPPDTDAYMSRAQTDEWKGWMQFIILLYHYFGMSRVLWIYRIIRCLVGAYLFLTGYGHTLYFMKTNDLSMRRIITVLMRLNLLAGVLAWTMGTTWDFYYFPALSSFWFLIVYLTLYRPKHITMTLTETLTRILISLAFVSVIIYIGIFGKLLIRLTSLKHSEYLSPAEAAREFEFRVKLDLLAPYAGMLLGVAQTKMWSNFATVNTRKSRLALFATPAGVVLLGGYLWMIRYFDDKQTYNKWHPLLSIAPITAYIVLRNSSSTCRAHHSRLFAWLGRCSLETFVLQYHIWLAMDTKATLHLGILDLPGASGNVAIASFASWRYWVEKAFLTAIFLWFSNAVCHATNELVANAIGGRKK